MVDKKKKGSFYTPKIISDFLVNYLSKKLKGKHLSVLEPSSGDGVFVKSIFDHSLLSNNIEKIVAVEIEKKEIEKVKLISNKKSLITILSDFLEFQKNNDQKFDLVLGNPPYIKKNLLTEIQVLNCESIHREFSSLSNNKIKNIWTSFLIRSISFVNEKGILAFILPSELLQVKYADEIRKLLLLEFERIEIFTFKELLFDECKGQDTIILIAERRSTNKGVYYCNIENIENIHNYNFTLTQNIKIVNTKWTHHHLLSDEIELLHNVGKKFNKVNDYCNSKTGIVTAANSYFIIDEKVVNEFSLDKYVRKIIKKSSFVNESVVLSSNDFRKLVDSSKPTFLLSLAGVPESEIDDKLRCYLDKGESLNVHKRYKTSRRRNWYEVPNVGDIPQALFFKRCNEYPKFIKNEADVLSTDSAYVVNMNVDFEIDNFIYSFYNSITLSFAELNGRYYGGGVLELTPNEFKSLPISYIDIKKDDFDLFKDNFKNKKSIKDICLMNDMTIFKSIDDEIDIETIVKLNEIREKMYLYRVKSL